MNFLFSDTGKSIGLFIAICLMIPSVMRAGELSNEEKIRIIGEIAEEAVKDRKDIDMRDVYRKVAQHMPLKPGETAKSRVMLDQWARAAEKKYYARKNEITRIYCEEAARKIILYKPGDHVKIQCSHNGINYTVSGKFYRITETHVIIGARSIPRGDFPNVTKFDSDKTEKLRRRYIENKIEEGLGSKNRFIEKYVDKQKKESRDYQLLLGKLLYDGKYFSADDLTLHFVKMKQAKQNHEMDETLSHIRRLTSTDLRIERLSRLLKENEGNRFESVIRKRISEEEDTRLNEKLSEIAASSQNTDVRLKRLEQLLEENKGTRFESVIRKRIAEEEDTRLNEKLSEIVASSQDSDVRIKHMEQLLEENKGTRFEPVIRKRIAQEEDNKLNEKLAEIFALSNIDVRIERLEQLLKENEGTRFNSVIQTKLEIEKDRREEVRRMIEEERRRAEEERQRIPLSPKFVEKYPFTWKNASFDTIREWNKEIISEKESDGKQTINAVGKDGVIRSFQFDSSKQLASIICKIDMTDSANNLDMKYKKNEKTIQRYDGMLTITTWEDIDSNTEIRIVTFGGVMDEGYIKLSYRQ